MHNSLHNRLHVVIALSFLPTMWIYMHSLPQVEPCLKKLQPGDNLINQLSVISTLNRWCLRQIAFLSFSLGLKKMRGLFDDTDAFIFCPSIPCLQVINVSVAKSMWVVRACLRLISSPRNSALPAYNFRKPAPSFITGRTFCCRFKSTDDNNRSYLEVKATCIWGASFMCRILLSISATGSFKTQMKSNIKVTFEWFIQYLSEVGKKRRRRQTVKLVYSTEAASL